MRDTLIASDVFPAQLVKSCGKGKTIRKYATSLIRQLPTDSPHFSDVKLRYRHGHSFDTWESDYRVSVCEIAVQRFLRLSSSVIADITVEDALCV